MATEKHVHRWTQFGDRKLWQCHCGKTKKSPPIDYRDVAKRRSIANAARKKREGETNEDTIVKRAADLEIGDVFAHPSGNTMITQVKKDGDIIHVKVNDDETSVPLKSDQKVSILSDNRLPMIRKFIRAEIQEALQEAVQSLVGKIVDINKGFYQGHWAKVIDQDGDNLMVSGGSVGDTVNPWVGRDECTVRKNKEK